MDDDFRAAVSAAALFLLALAGLWLGLLLWP